MDINKIMDALCAISGRSYPQVSELRPLIEYNISLVEDESLPPEQQARLEKLVVARTNYEMALCGNEGVSSFSAGDVKITQNARDDVERAKEMYNLALEDARDCIDDKYFAFMGV